MKIFVKSIIFIFTLLVCLYNIAIFSSVVLLLSKIRADELFWWPREAFYISPFIFLGILGLSYAGAMLSFSALWNFKEERRAALKNAFKYLLASIIGFSSIVLLISEIGRIKGKLGNILEGDGSFGFTSDWQMRKTSLILLLIIFFAYIWVHYQERMLIAIISQKRKRWNKFLYSSIAACFLIIGLLIVAGYFQDKVINPGVGSVKKSAKFTVYGLKDSESYRWIRPLRYDSGQQEVNGLLVMRNGVFLPIEFIEKKNSIQNDEEITNYANENSFAIKEFHFGKVTFRGYEETAQDGWYRRGKFIWHTDSGTDVIVSGIVMNSSDWEDMTKEIANNFIGQ